jgi:excisionase family DNA binding protein
MEKLYSIQEAADLLRVSHWTLRGWIQLGKLRSAKIGDRRVIRESELMRLVVDDPRPIQTTAIRGKQ